MNLSELNLSDEEYAKILLIARIFKAQKMSVSEIIVDKTLKSDILVTKEDK